MLPTKKTLSDGDNVCTNQYDAEMILFDTNSEVDSVIKLIQKGIVDIL
jgi:hypothetical protein